MQNNTDRFKIKRLKRSKLRNAILEGAAQSFRIAGYDSTTLKDIAQAADVNSSTIYKYFTCKQHIYDEVVKDSVEDFWINLTSEFTDSEDWHEKLEILINHHLTQFEKDPRLHRDLWNALIFDQTNSKTKKIKYLAMAMYLRSAMLFSSICEDSRKGENEDVLELLRLLVYCAMQAMVDERFKSYLPRNPTEYAPALYKIITAVLQSE